MRGIAALIAAGIGFLFFIIFVFSTYFTIDQGERGVITHYGAVVGEAEPGFHLKMPFVTAITKISIRVERACFVKDNTKCYAPMESYSRDQQPATISLAVNYHVTDPTRIYNQYGDLDAFDSRVVASKATEILKNVFGQFEAADAIQQRAKLNAQVTLALQAALAGQPAMVDSVQIQDISFSNQYEQAVEARMQAIVKQQQAEADKQKRMIDADAAKYEKEANADATLYAAQAEAKGIQAKGDALRNNPELVSLTIAQKWDGQLPTTMVPGGSLPLLNMK